MNIEQRITIYNMQLEATLENIHDIKGLRRRRKASLAELKIRADRLLEHLAILYKIRGGDVNE